jgi:GT2 family glycosyltransferase
LAGFEYDPVGAVMSITQESIQVLASKPHRALDIIVPIYRNAGLASECIRSILDHIDEIAELEPRLVLVNDSPGDDDVVLLLEAPWLTKANTVVLTNPRNLGFIGSVNRALAGSRRDRRDVLLVNSDTRTFPGTLRNLLSAVRSDPQIAFGSPRSNNAALCSLPHFFGGAIGDPYTSWERWRALSSSMPAWHFSPTAVGFYMYIRYDVLADHGLLDEEFGRGYEEENDLVMRAGKVGKRAIIVNNAFAYHAGSASFNLSDIDDLDGHRHANHALLAQRHPEFMQLVQRYERSALFRAERLLSGLLPDDHGRLRVAVDLTGLGQHHNGTNEHTVAVVKALAHASRHKYRITGVASAESFRFHGLDLVDGLLRADPNAPGVHAVAIRIAQPFLSEHVVRVESMAPTCIYAMLDTIAEDCGPTSVEYDVKPLWDHVSTHSSGIIFNSAYSESTFQTRHPVAVGVTTRACLLSTDIDEYKELDAPANEARSHVLIVGNHFPHKGTRRTVEILRRAYPQLSFVALSDETREDGNVSSFRSGSVDRTMMRHLYRAASVVVLPSHMEGFGMGLMHALANRKPVVARRIPPTLEILDRFDAVTGVELFDTDADLVEALRRGLSAKESRATPGSVTDWAGWANALGCMINTVVTDKALFPKLRHRLEAMDSLNALLNGTGGCTHASDTAVSRSVPAPLPVEALLELEGDAFLEAAYATLLRRFADADGLATYRVRLSGPAGKIGVLAALCGSPEGVQNADPKLVATITLLNGAEHSSGTPSGTDGVLSDQAIVTRQQLCLDLVLQCSGVLFIESAYRMVLDREPDEAGQQTYMRMLGAGASRIDVLFALYESIEARALGKHIPELEALKADSVKEPRRVKWRSLFAR